MKKLFKLMIPAIAAAVVFTGCATSSAQKKQAEKISAEEADDVKVAADKYCEDIINSINNKDYKLFLTLIPDEYQQQMNEEKFDEMLEQIAKQQGKLIGKPAYWGVLDKKIFQIFYWKTTFEREVENKKTKEMETIQVDYVLTLMIGKLDGKYHMMRFLFQ